ncbi:hypothetical protein ADK67_05980 [Saccharothrix sp. NRRL B-16348]|uniref:DUF5667 domain-containing protein n=1 Tax=Saccharothrix sp. NRRL B-16348 TaxID=1415542 RepID=UPI0006B04B4E|nr:DUF5667 domain-containing protein [Saccharothrix sp. NRRL B-16348]KOX33839.1 hypothetical protein ADK67_05980 [Saccharothrix sp. NRRL B-16348]
MVGKGITPLWRHRQREQFARAVDAHPGSEPAEGDELADDLAVVALLRKAAVTAGPDEAAKARMRARVLGAAEPPPTKLDRPVRERRAGARGRLAVALAAALCLLFSLAGMSLLLSRDALPGDALYGVKRTAESASLGLTFDEESKGHKRLEFAAARVAEIETLVDRYRESGGGPLGGYLTALTDFDADAAAGSRVLAALGTNSDRRALVELRDWAGSQAARLAELRAALPTEAADRADTSLELLDRIADRASALHARADCASVTSGQVDQVGPVPAEDECAAPPVDPRTSPTGLPSVPPAPTDVAPTTSGNTPGGTSTPGGVPGTGTPSLPSAPTTTTPGPLLPLPTLTLPSLPLPGLSG